MDEIGKRKNRFKEIFCDVPEEEKKAKDKLKKGEKVEKIPLEDKELNEIKLNI